MISVARTLLTTNALVTVILLVGFVNNIAIAVIFGLTRHVDAYYAALIIPQLFMAMCLDYLGKNFLPTFAKARRESEQTASEFTSSIVTTVGLLSLAVALLLALTSGPLFGLLLPGFTDDDIVLVQRCFWIMAPGMAVMGITAFHEYVCQHDEDYVRITLIRGLLPLANLAAIVVTSPFIGEYALPVGYLVGNLLVFVLMTIRARYRYKWRVVIQREWEGKVFTNSAIVMSGGLLGRTRQLIANYLGSLLGEGAISALALATRLTEPLRRTVFSAAKMWMFSRTARLALDKKALEIARLYDIGLSAVFLLVTPLLWWIGLYSRTLVEAIFGHGRFDATMSDLVSLALVGILPSVAFTGVANLLSNAFYALNRVLIPALVGPLGALLYLFIAPALNERYEILGITAATSITALFTFTVLVICVTREIPAFSAKKALLHMMRYTAAGGVCFGLAALWMNSLGLPAVASALLSLAVGLALYVLLLFLSRDSMLTFLYAFAKKAVRVPVPLDTTSR